jgi:hypothetical protein
LKRRASQAKIKVKEHLTQWNGVRYSPGIPKCSIKKLKRERQTPTTSTQTKIM